jgi:hypothetical protein
LTITAEGPEQQEFVEEILDSIKGPPVKKIDIKVMSKKFLPYEVGLLILVEFVVQASSKLIIKVLDDLWKKLTAKKITIVLEEIPRVQARAETYLKSIGIHSFEIREMVDGGIYASFIFVDKKGELHDIFVSKTDLQILKYSRRKTM